MTTFKNPSAEGTLRTSEDAGQLTYNRFTFDVANLTTFTHVTSDKFIAGVVPAGEVLVPHLCRLSIPKLDTHGTSTGTVSVGTADDPDALKASTSTGAAIDVTGTALLSPATPVGSATAETVIYVSALTATATLATSGKVVFEQVTRPWDSTLDG